MIYSKDEFQGRAKENFWHATQRSPITRHLAPVLAAGRAPFRLGCYYGGHFLSLRGKNYRQLRTISILCVTSLKSFVQYYQRRWNNCSLNTGDSTTVTFINHISVCLQLYLHPFTHSVFLLEWTRQLFTVKSKKKIGLGSKKSKGFSVEKKKLDEQDYEDHFTILYFNP